MAKNPSKNRNKKEYVAETICGRQSLKIFIIVPFAEEVCQSSLETVTQSIFSNYF